MFCRRYKNTFGKLTGAYVRKKSDTYCFYRHKEIVYIFIHNKKWLMLFIIRLCKEEGNSLHMKLSNELQHQDIFDDNIRFYFIELLGILTWLKLKWEIFHIYLTVQIVIEENSGSPSRCKFYDKILV